MINERDTCGSICNFDTFREECDGEIHTFPGTKMVICPYLKVRIIRNYNEYLNFKPILFKIQIYFNIN
jgi:hypothetical protein